MTGVLVLPFHIAITLSGLVIFTSIYYPGVAERVYRGDREALDREVSGGYRRVPAGRPGTLASLDAMAAEAARRWDGVPPRAVRVLYPGDVHAYVMVEKDIGGSVTARDGPRWNSGRSVSRGSRRSSMQRFGRAAPGSSNAGASRSSLSQPSCSTPSPPAIMCYEVSPIAISGPWRGWTGCYAPER